MKLFKYVGFHVEDKSKQPVWDQPLIQQSLYLSPIDELRNVNDEAEFHHAWNHPSYFFNRFATQAIQPRYDRIFLNAHTLCLSKVMSRGCWARFCPQGGICYEFDYSEDSKNSDITAGPIFYAESKISNVPEFIISKVSNTRTSSLLAQSNELSQLEMRDVHGWLSSGEPNRISMDHIVNEMTFKKLKAYDVENEFRFIHPKEPMDNKTTKLVDSKLSFSSLGLSLRRVFISDLEKFPSSLKGAIKVGKPSFLD